MQLIRIFTYHFLMRTLFSVYFVLYGKRTVVKIYITERRTFSALELWVIKTCRVDITKTYIVDVSTVYAFIWVNRYINRFQIYITHHDSVKQNILNQRFLTSDIGGYWPLFVEYSDVSAFTYSVRKINRYSVFGVGNCEI